MQLDWIKPLIGTAGPFITVYLDVTRGDEFARREIDNRWQGLKRSLESQGAPAELIEQVGERVAVPSHLAGPHGRVVVAHDGGVALDRLLSKPPTRDEAVYADAPALMPAARAADEAVTYLLVVVDRTGADFTWSSPMLPDDLSEPVSVSGEHDVLHKVRTGGTAERRLQARAEDSWERNAEKVAQELDRAVAKRQPELVLITGDVRAVALVCEAVSERTKQLMVEIPGGARNEGVNEAAFEQTVLDAVARFRDRRRNAVLTRFREERGKDRAAVTGVADVLSALRRGQVSDLILDGEQSPGRLRDRTLWIGPDALQVADSATEVREIGAEEPEPLRADIAMLRAAVGQDAGITFVADVDDLIDGVGAILRWHDAATPSETVLTQSGDTHRGL